MSQKKVLKESGKLLVKMWASLGAAVCVVGTSTQVQGAELCVDMQRIRHI